MGINLKIGSVYYLFVLLADDDTWLVHQREVKYRIYYHHSSVLILLSVMFISHFVYNYYYLSSVMDTDDPLLLWINHINIFLVFVECSLLKEKSAKFTMGRNIIRWLIITVMTDDSKL